MHFRRGLTLIHFATFHGIQVSTHLLFYKGKSILIAFALRGIGALFRLQTCLSFDMLLA